MANYTYQAKHNFTAGEVSPLLFGRTDFDRYKNGCRSLENMVILSQGPTTRRSGFEYITSLNEVGIDVDDPQVRMVPFIFNELQSYAMILFNHTSGDKRCVFATDEGLVAYTDPPPTECPVGTVIDPPVAAGDVVFLSLGTEWDNAYFDYAQSGDYLYCAQGTLQPSAIIRNSPYCWTLEQLTFTDQPTEWSSTDGWPETVTFIQQRLGYAGTTTYRQTVWLSRAGDFEHFGSLDPANLVDADAVSFTLDSGTQNKIVWMQTVKQLHIGTIGNEWIITGNGQDAITPSSVLTQSPTNQGSERVKPLRIGLTTLFVEQHGRVVNEFVFDYNYDSYKASDISILAPHLTDHYSFYRWTYQQTPSSVVWNVREDGALIGLTYHRQHAVIAWHPHSTDGEFVDVCSIPGERREDDLWAVIKREVEGLPVYYVEKKAEQFTGTEAIEGNFLDSFLRYEGVATKEIYGLDHLEGKEVRVLADGSVHPPRTVANGMIELYREATNVLVGLGFRSQVDPLLQEVESRDLGGSLTRKQRILQYNVELYNSLGFEMGTIDIDGNERVEQKPFRVPTDDVGEALPLFSGVYKVDGFEGFDRKAQYFIRQEQPLPLTVIGIVDMIEVKK